MTPAGGHRKRHAARRTAIEVLYEADVMGRAPARVLDEWRSAGRSIPDYAAELVDKVTRQRSEIDGVLAAHSDEWPVHRMAVVDRTILRVACAELSSGLPVAVAINEAVTIAGELASDDSGRFINGILGRVAREMEPDDGTDREMPHRPG